MAAIARALFRKVPYSNTEADAVMTIALFCAAGLFVSLLLAAYGLDLSPGFF
jgi:hypothetical protein